MSIDSKVARAHELGAGETAWPTVALCLVAAALQAAFSACYASGLWPAWATVLLNTACAYAQFTVLHDATHFSLSRRAWVNDLFGVIATLALAGPFEAMRRNHLHHHAHTNDPEKDPDFWVAGRNWPSTILRCLTTLQVHYWVYFTRLRRTDRAFASAVVTIVGVAAAHLWAWRAGVLTTMLLCWTLPAQLAVAALAFTFDYWPHRPHTERGRLRDTANITPLAFDPFFLRQNLHAIHHLYPTIPWYRYRDAYEETHQALRRAGVPHWGLREAVRALRPGPLPR